MIILGLDFETTAQDPATASVAEVGAILWSTELRKPVRSMGYLVYDRDARWESGATEVNGITQEQCATYGYDNESALKRLIAYYQMANVVCTHNGNIFDRIVYENWCERLGYLDYKNQGKIWIDTKVDIPYPKSITTRKLKHIAAEHGILHNHAHSALEDAKVMLDILNFYDLNVVMESAASPTVTVQALVSYADREKAKTQGYYWRPNEKQWIKAVKASRLAEESEQAGFPIRVLKN